MQRSATSEVSALPLIPGQVAPHPSTGKMVSITSATDITAESMVKDLQFVALGGQHIARAKQALASELFDGKWDLVAADPVYSTLPSTTAEIAVGLTQQESLTVSNMHNAGTVFLSADGTTALLQGRVVYTELLEQCQGGVLAQNK